VPAYNSFLYDGNLYDGGMFAGASSSTDRVVFDAFSLSDNTTLVCSAIEDSGPTREIVGGNIPRGDGQYVTGAYFRERTVVVSGWVKAATAAAMDTLLDTVRKALRNREANLDLTDAAGTVRRFVATCDNYDQLFAGRQYYHVTICPFVARFRCKVPFGFSRGYASASQIVAASPSTIGANPGGDYKTFPVITLNFSSASSVTSIDLNNVTTGEDIAYSGTAAANDIFVFDGEQKTVTKNGTAVDFSGAFLTLEPRDNSVVLTMNGTFSVNVTVAYRSCYL
jgi:hypothetical protein